MIIWGNQHPKNKKILNIEIKYEHNLYTQSQILSTDRINKQYYSTLIHICG